MQAADTRQDWTQEGTFLKIETALAYAVMMTLSFWKSRVQNRTAMALSLCYRQEKVAKYCSLRPRSLLASNRIYNNRDGLWLVEASKAKLYLLDEQKYPR